MIVLKASITMSAPRLLTRSTLAVLVVVATVASTCFANWMANVPTKPEPSLTTTRCPFFRFARSMRACQAVKPTMAGSGRSSNRISRGPYKTVACMSHLFFNQRRNAAVFTITCGMASPSSVLFVGDVFEPVDGLAIELLLHGDVRHRGRGRRAMPVLFAGREPHHVTRSNLVNGSAPALHPAA